MFKCILSLSSETYAAPSCSDTNFRVTGHPNIRAFITQGGQQSLEEAIRSNVPLIGIPFIADQAYNVKKIMHMSIGLGLNIDTVDKTALKEAIYEVAENVKYRESIRRLSEQLEDRPETGLERAVWWSEYVIRHKGALHLRAPSVPLYQYFLLDILALVALVLLAAVLACYAALRLAWSYYFGVAKLKRT